jgi:broad specificity phosphatase PhoE
LVKDASAGILTSISKLRCPQFPPQAKPLPSILGGVNDTRPQALLIRHGETTWSATGRHTGRTDIPLTEAGEQQAQVLGARLAARSVGGLVGGSGGGSFALALCSPLTRARRTAELAGFDPSTLSFDSDLLEWDYGDFEGRTTDDIRRDFPGWTIWDGPWPGGETIDQVAVRADRVVARVRNVASGTVALVGHGHMLRVVAARWLGAPPQAGRWLALETGTLSELGWEHESGVIHRWNA